MASKGIGRIVESRGISRKLDALVDITVWIWLPFVAFFLLIKKIMEHRKSSQ